MFVHSVKTNDRAPIDIPARKNDLKCKILWLSVKFQKQNLNTLTIKHVFTLKLLKSCKHLEFFSLQINLNLNGKSQNIHGEISLNLI